MILFLETRGYLRLFIFILSYAGCPNFLHFHLREVMCETFVSKQHFKLDLRMSCQH